MLSVGGEKKRPRAVGQPRGKRVRHKSFLERVEDSLEKASWSALETALGTRGLVSPWMGSAWHWEHGKQL